MATAWVILWLTVGAISWPLSISAGIAAGVGCSGFIFWVSGRRQAPTLGQSAISLIVGVLVLVFVFFIVAVIRNWLEERLKNA